MSNLRSVYASIFSIVLAAAVSAARADVLSECHPDTDSVANVVWPDMAGTGLEEGLRLFLLNTGGEPVSGAEHVGIVIDHDDMPGSSCHLVSLSEGQGFYRAFVAGAELISLDDEREIHVMVQEYPEAVSPPAIVVRVVRISITGGQPKLLK